MEASLHPHQQQQWIQERDRNTGRSRTSATDLPPNSITQSHRARRGTPEVIIGRTSHGGSKRKRREHGRLHRSGRTSGNNEFHCGTGDGGAQEAKKRAEARNSSDAQSHGQDVEIYTTQERSATSPLATNKRRIWMKITEDVSASYEQQLTVRYQPFFIGTSRYLAARSTE